jgi:hypothetical protein
MVLLAVITIGCATGQAGGGGGGGNGGDQYFVFGPGNAFSIKLEGPRLFGPELDVVKLADGYRGQFRGDVIDLRSDGNHVAGTIAGRHTDLHVEPIGDGSLIQGVFADNLSRIELAPDRIKGNIGNTSYDLLRQGTDALRYQWRSHQGWLDLPPSLVSRPLDEQAIWLMLFLGTSRAIR